jgi:predicted transcriptional regulator
MNIQARKLGLIEEFLQISDESLIIKLEDVIRKEKKIAYERKLKPMLIDEFHEMIDEAIRDRDAGRVISHQELSKKIKTWK